MAIISIQRKGSVNVFHILQVVFLHLLKQWKNVNHAVVKAGDK